MYHSVNSPAITKVTAAIVFVFFVFFFLYDWQGYCLAVTQHILSHGVTHYDLLYGAVLITLILFLLQVVIYRVTRLEGRTHTLTYFPSLLFLTMLTAVKPDATGSLSLGVWLVAGPVLLLIWVGGVAVARQTQVLERIPMREGHVLTKHLWVNLFALCVMMVMTAVFSNNDAVYHYRAKMEYLMLHERYADALQVGRYSQETDSSLTALRIICLEKTHTLGSRLFTYPVVGGSAVMKASCPDVHILMWQDPHVRIFLRKGKRVYPLTLEHRLTAFMLDKNLDGFARLLTTRYSGRLSALPLHIREALVLYTHKRSHPKIVYNESVMDADFKDYRSLYLKTPDPQIRQNQLRDNYGSTYWYYYQYE